MIKIMIVDDEYFEREAFKMLIQNKMVDCEIVADFDNGKDAYEHMKENEVDLIFMDVKMPIMNGIEATKLIKAMNPDQYVIILTAYADFELAQQAVKIHANDYLLKPSRPEKIKDAIEAFKKFDESLDKKSKVDYIKAFKHALIKGHYLETLDVIEKIRQAKAVSNEMATVIDDLLDIIVEAGEYFSLTFSNQTKKEMDSYRTNVKRQDEYITFIDRLVDDIFAHVIKKKMGNYEKEMDYALDYIELNLTEHVTLEDVSGYMNISAHYFSKIFKRDMDINFVQYVTERKVEQAKRMLMKSNQPIINIAYDLGFNEANYFSKVFKKNVGQTPSQYRNSVKEAIS